MKKVITYFLLIVLTFQHTALASDSLPKSGLKIVFDRILEKIESCTLEPNQVDLSYSYSAGYRTIQQNRSLAIYALKVVFKEDTGISFDFDQGVIEQQTSINKTTTECFNNSESKKDCTKMAQTYFEKFLDLGNKSVVEENQNLLFCAATLTKAFQTFLQGN